MRQSSTMFLQAVIVLIGIAVLVFLLGEPHVEGVNAHATSLREIYFDDPFLAYIYLGSIPFFVGLYHAFKALGYARQNKAFSEPAVRAVRTIKYCALVTAAAIVGADAFLMIMARRTGEDAAGAVALGIIATFLSIVAAAAAAVIESLLVKAAASK